MPKKSISVLNIKIKETFELAPLLALTINISSQAVNKTKDRLKKSISGWRESLSWGKFRARKHNANRKPKEKTLSFKKRKKNRKINFIIAFKKRSLYI